MRSVGILQRTWSLLALSGIGCTGVVNGTEASNAGGSTAPTVAEGGNGSGGDPSTASGGSSQSMSGNGGGGGQAAALDCTSPQAPVLHARLLTPSQYEHAVEDLFQVGGEPAKDFGGGVAALLDEVAVERRATAAALIATQAVQNLAQWSPCSPTATEPAACGTQIIGYLGRAGFRHPLSETERAGLQKLFDAGFLEAGFATGVEWLLTGLLQAPDFLYQFAKPLAAEQPGQIVSLSAYELASRLSFFIWDTLPDDALLSAAESGALASDVGLDSELARLFADPRFVRGAEEFYTRWLGLESFREVARDDPALTSEVSALLQRSLLMSATAIYSEPAPNISGLLSGESYYLNDVLGALYGAPGGGAGGGAELEFVALPNQGRHGILTHPGLLTLLARPAASDPIARGLFVQRTLLCNEIPPPPAGVVIPPLAAPAEGLSTRARLEQHTVQPLCAGCHGQIDPPGFALESFDELGRFRSSDEGVQVDTSGEMKSGDDTDGAFVSGSELFQRIAGSNDVKRCFAKHYLEHAVLRGLTDADACALDRVASAFAANGDLKQLITAVAKSDAFRLRATEDSGAP